LNEGKKCGYFRSKTRGAFGKTSIVTNEIKRGLEEKA